MRGDINLVNRYVLSFRQVHTRHLARERFHERLEPSRRRVRDCVAHRSLVYTYSRRWTLFFVAPQNFSDIEILVLQAFRWEGYKKTLGDTAVIAYGNGFSCMAVHDKRARMFNINWQMKTTRRASA